ncbi:hypothetical protein [Microcystis phage Mvi-JY20]|uniref:Uncharacterized protein n=1 Tax=Microcystis phage Mvi-JY20 TaxID=3128146 RepID=A0AAX4QI51_9CAUD
MLRYTAKVVRARGMHDSGYYGVVYDTKAQRSVRVCTLIVSEDRARRIANSMLEAHLKDGETA